MSRAWSIRLERESSGAFVFNTHDFHPIDYQLLGNGPDEHNFYFTFEIDCTFEAQPGAVHHPSPAMMTAGSSSTTAW